MKLEEVPVFFYTTQALEQLQEQMKKGQEVLKEALSDKEWELNDRWELFLKFSHLLPIEDYGDGEHEVLAPGSNLYSDFNVERHQTRTYKDMDEQIQDVILTYKENPEDEWCKEDGPIYTANYDAWREAVLSRGYGGYTFDW